MTCTATSFHHHNTDDPNQPYLDLSIGLTGPAECENAKTLLEYSYKDKAGVLRTEGFSVGTGDIGVVVYGVYGLITGTANAHFRTCDTTRSATCDVAVHTAPK